MTQGNDRTGMGEGKTHRAMLVVEDLRHAHPSVRDIHPSHVDEHTLAARHNTEHMLYDEASRCCNSDV